MSTNNNILKLRTHPNFLQLAKLLGKLHRLNEKKQSLEQVVKSKQDFENILTLSDKIEKVGERINRLL